MTKFTDYFNSTTIRGRANVAKATYASFAALYLYKRFTRRKNKSNETPIKNADIENYTQKTKDNGSLEHYKCPSYESDQENKKVDERQNLHEATPPLDSHASPSKPHHNQDNTTAIAESIVKSSKSKCESGCDITTTTTTPRINYEQKSDDV